jgi:hypothetical protein
MYIFMSIPCSRSCMILEMPASRYAHVEPISSRLGIWGVFLAVAVLVAILKAYHGRNVYLCYGLGCYRMAGLSDRGAVRLIVRDGPVVVVLWATEEILKSLGPSQY